MDPQLQQQQLQLRPLPTNDEACAISIADVTQRSMLNGSFTYNPNEPSCCEQSLQQPPIYVSSSYEGGPKCIDPIESQEDTLRQFTECVSEVYIFKKLKTISGISIVTIITSLASIAIPTIGGCFYSAKIYNISEEFRNTDYNVGGWAFAVPLLGLVFMLLHASKLIVYTQIAHYIPEKIKNSKVLFSYINKKKLTKNFRISIAGDSLSIAVFAGQFIGCLTVAIALLSSVSDQASCEREYYSYSGYYWRRYCSGLSSNSRYTAAAGFMIFAVVSAIVVTLCLISISEVKFQKILFGIQKKKKEEEDIPRCKILNIAKLFAKI